MMSRIQLHRYPKAIFLCTRPSAGETVHPTLLLLVQCEAGCFSWQPADAGSIRRRRAHAKGTSGGKVAQMKASIYQSVRQEKGSERGRDRKERERERERRRRRRLLLLLLLRDEASPSHDAASRLSCLRADSRVSYCAT